MDSDNLNVRLTGELRAHLRAQVGSEGLYANASEYVRDLIRQDKRNREASWAWLREDLREGLLADDSQFVEESAADAIARNKKRLGV